MTPPTTPSTTPWLMLKDFCVYIHGKPYIQNISLSLSGSSSLAIFGPTGSGKSLLLKGLMGLLPVSGKLNVLEYTAQCSEREGKVLKLSQMYDEIGFAFQYNGLFDFCTVEENLLFRHLYHSRNTHRPQNRSLSEDAKDILEHLGLWEHRHKFPTQLSGGQKKRLAIARALMKHPRVLITDDPLAGLDPISAELVLGRLLDSVRHYNVGLIASISSAALPKGRFTHCLVVNRGQSIFFGSSEAFDQSWPTLSRELAP